MGASVVGARSPRMSYEARLFHVGWWLLMVKRYDRSSPGGRRKSRVWVRSRRLILVVASLAFVFSLGPISRVFHRSGSIRTSRVRPRGRPDRCRCGSRAGELGRTRRLRRDGARWRDRAGWIAVAPRTSGAAVRIMGASAGGRPGSGSRDRRGTTGSTFVRGKTDDAIRSAYEDLKRLPGVKDVFVQSPNVTDAGVTAFDAS